MWKNWALFWKYPNVFLLILGLEWLKSGFFSGKNPRFARKRANEKEKRVHESAFEENRRLARKRANEKKKRVSETAFEKKLQT